MDRNCKPWPDTLPVCKFKYTVSQGARCDVAVEKITALLSKSKTGLECLTHIGTDIAV